MEKSFIEIFAASDPSDVYKKLSEQFIESYEKTFKAITEKSDLLDRIYSFMALLVIFTLVFFCLYIVYNLNY